MKDFQEAAARLERGDVIGLPTETVYGLAARVDRHLGIEKIFRVKARPFFDPLIVHVSSVDQARSLTSVWPLAADILARRFWPGPLTLVLPKAGHVDSQITSGLETVALRCPKHPVALELLRTLNVPLAAPSANRFGRTSPTTSAHVRSEFPEENLLILEGGPCEVGIESTILKVSPMQGSNVQLSILRQGSIGESLLTQALAQSRISCTFESPVAAEAPGQMKHHYMPPIPLVYVQRPQSEDLGPLLAEINSRLAEFPHDLEGVALPKPTAPLRAPMVLQLNENPIFAARELYAKLRELGRGPGDLLIFFHESSMIGESWSGILDRIQKAASLHLT